MSLCFLYISQQPFEDKFLVLVLILFYFAFSYKALTLLLFLFIYLFFLFFFYFIFQGVLNEKKIMSKKYQESQHLLAAATRVSVFFKSPLLYILFVSFFLPNFSLYTHFISFLLFFPIFFCLFFYFNQSCSLLAHQTIQNYGILTNF